MVDLLPQRLATAAQYKLQYKPYKWVVGILRPLPCFMLEDITTEPHAHDISADIVRVWLSATVVISSNINPSHPSNELLSPLQ
jgi:hypothetical protein